MTLRKQVKTHTNQDFRARDHEDETEKATEVGHEEDPTGPRARGASNMNLLETRWGEKQRTLNQQFAHHNPRGGLFFFAQLAY